jgi:hypothetical protein
MAHREAPETTSIEALDRLEKEARAETREERDPGRGPTAGRFQPGRPSGGT